MIRETLESKKRRLGFKSVCMSLSAGIDSGLTLVMIKKFLPGVKVKCFSMGFGDKDDETERAREIAEAYDCDFYGIEKRDILSDLPRLVSIVREPRWNLYHYYLMEEARKESDVFFAGDGGDELFGGYTFRYKKFLSLLPRGGGWRERAKLYLSCHERDWVPDQEKMFGSRVRFSWDRIYRIFKPYFDNRLDALDQVFLADFNGKLLYDWLPANKAFGRALRLNIESIFLNRKMIKFATHVPWQMKYDPAEGRGKLVLHSILSTHKGFEDLKPVKKGFSVNLDSLWERSSREIVTRYVNEDSSVVKEKIISGKWIEGAYRKLEGDSETRLRYLNKLLGVLALEVWFKLFVSKELKRSDKL